MGEVESDRERDMMEMDIQRGRWTVMGRETDRERWMSGRGPGRTMDFNKVTQGELIVEPGLEGPRGAAGPDQPAV